MLEASNLSLRRNGSYLLKDVNWTINKGEHWSLLGLNGSGKTTLLNILNGYIWPTEGTISVLGNRFGTCDLGDLRKKIGWVSNSLQEKMPPTNNPLQIALSGVYASIGLYEEPSEDTIAKAVQLLTEFGCEEFIERNYNTLSQGEKQKVLIVRALMAEPDLLILDEPCTGLDLFAREQLLLMIQKVAEKEGGPTLIYVTHHVEEILPCFSHTLLLKAGEVFQKGQTDEVMTSATLSKFFGTSLQLEERRKRKWLSLV
ncbi:ABC transporter ATP-binding protein [Pullulanibacillus sp. KACC 23026]|nr:ABC transporter ATP-binding protein [Pullulanibacillus sp. KACC 23026]WEG14948.1 ABC transporter ATP-binding protein [Pullulanibacillus sp. KACC 23026]